MDKKAIDESILFRRMYETHLRVGGQSEALLWLACHVGMLVSKVEDLQQEVKTLKKKGVKDGRPKGIRGSKVRKGSNEKSLEKDD